MFKALIWGIVRFCRSNITGDMIKKLKNCFFKKCQFLHFLLKLKVKNCFLKKQLFSILIISLVIFDLQKCTIPQIKALNILFWLCFIHFTARMDIWWAMKLRKCAVFFPQTLHILNFRFLYFQDKFASIYQEKAEA